MIVAVVGALILACVVAFVVAVARDPGPGPLDVAVAYEHAWDRLDFDALWRLSGPALRGGQDRRTFIERHREAGDPRILRHQLRRVEVEALQRHGPDAVVVVTRPVHRDGTRLRNEVVVVRTDEGWLVQGFTPAPSPVTGFAGP